MNVLMISMDDTLLTGAIGDLLARHRDYARRAGRLDIVVCSTQPLKPLAEDSLRIVPTSSRTRISYVLDGSRLGRQLAATRRPDAITTQDALLTGLAGLRLRRALKAPLIVQGHTTMIGNPIYSRERPINRVFQRLASYVLRRADVIRVVNEGEKAALIQIGIASDRIHVIPVATDVARFAQPDHRIDWRAQLGFAASDRIALWVGRPVHFKNLPLLLSAFALVHSRLSTARLALAGDMTGTTYPALAEQLGLQDVVKMTGLVAHADLPSLYQSADVYALSSYYEGLPRVLLEAAAAGLPLVSVDMDAARDVIKPGETGLLVAADVEALASGLLELLGDPERASAMGKQAQADVLQRFDPERLTGEWVGLWQQVAGQRSQQT